MVSHHVLAAPAQTGGAGTRGRERVRVQEEGVPPGPAAAWPSASASPSVVRYLLGVDTQRALLKCPLQGEQGQGPQSLSPSSAAPDLTLLSSSLRPVRTTKAEDTHCANSPSPWGPSPCRQRET